MQLLPVLKPARWDGLANGAVAHVWVGTPSEPVVVVAYAWSSDEGLSYVTEQSEEFPSRDAMVRQAFDNLELYHTDLEVVESAGGRMLVSAGRAFAAERILCQSHMLRAHEKLEAAEILVSIPRRGAMLASALECSDEVKQTMVKLHAESWADVSTDAEHIIDELIIVKDGRKSGTVPVADAHGAPHPLWA